MKPKESDIVTSAENLADLRSPYRRSYEGKGKKESRYYCNPVSPLRASLRWLFAVVMSKTPPSPATSDNNC